MNSRRAFLKNSCLAALGVAAGKGLLQSCTMPIEQSSIGLQLYTLREELEKNVIRTLERVAKIGFGHVETAYSYNVDDKDPKFWGMKVHDLKTILDKNNLATYSGHYQLNDFLTLGKGSEDALKTQVEIAATLGQKYFIVPVPPFELIDQLKLEDFQFMADQLNKGGEYCRQHGMKIGYHNHFWEFRKSGNDEKTGFQVMLENTSPDLVAFELDIFWTVKSGVDPVSLFQQYPGRFELWHVKDIDKEKTKVITGPEMDSLPSMDILGEIKFAEVGSGSVNFKEIFDEKDVSGLKHFFVEQDNIYIDDKFVSIKQSFDYINRNLI